MEAQETNGFLCYKREEEAQANSLCYKKEAEARETGTRPVSPTEYAMDGCTG